MDMGNAITIQSKRDMLNKHIKFDTTVNNNEITTRAVAREKLFLLYGNLTEYICFCHPQSG